MKTLTPAQIRRIRNSAGVTQAQFAEAVNLTANSIARIERGEFFPSGTTMQMLFVIRSYLERGGDIRDFAKSIGAARAV